jgi:choline dehydrogenase-like flavoprotein
MSSQTYDFVVVGAGSAGCVLANRLSENGRHSVLLLEAGPADRYLWIHIPIGYAKTMFHPVYNWGYYTDPDPNMNNRKIYWPRGRGLGGSSSINGLIYVRGQGEDYDAWAQAGNAGWAWRDVLPYFIRSEHNTRGASEYHGSGGPLWCSDIGEKHELMEAIIRAGNERGVPRNDDFNGATQEGVGYYQLFTRQGWRCSTAVAYLKPAKGRTNLRVETDAHATGILFEGARAVGLRYRRNGQEHEVRAAREVVLSAGALQSPQLLQLSGVGDAARLQALGIPVTHHLPGVGENLQDHLQMRLMYECTKPITTNDQLRTGGAGASWAAVAAAAQRAAGHRHQPGRLLHAGAARVDDARHPVPRRHAVGRHGRRQAAPVVGLHAVGVPAAAAVARHGVQIAPTRCRRRRCSPTTCRPRLDRRTPWRSSSRADRRGAGDGPYIREESPAPASPATRTRCWTTAATTAPPSSTPGTCKMGNDAHGRGRRAAARARHRRAARGRLFGDAHAGVGQHQCAGGDDCGKGVGPDPGRSRRLTRH